MVWIIHVLLVLLLLVLLDSCLLGFELLNLLFELVVLGNERRVRLISFR